MIYFYSNIFFKIDKINYICKKFIFADDTSFTLKSSKSYLGGLYIKCKKEERLNRGNVYNTYKFNFNKVKYWACVSYNGIGEIHKVDGKMDSKYYQNIIDTSYRNSIEKFNIKNCKILHDNETTHVCSGTLSYLKKKKNLDYVENFPSNSIDLNIIENVFNLWKTKVYQHNIKTVNDLEFYIEEEWKTIGTVVIRSLINSYSKRLDAIIDNNGWYSKY